MLHVKEPLKVKLKRNYTIGTCVLSVRKRLVTAFNLTVTQELSTARTVPKIPATQRKTFECLSVRILKGVKNL